MRHIIVQRRKDRKDTEVMERPLNLSGLLELLHNILLITEEVKEVLIKNSDEAALILKPWQVKIAIERREHDNICNCQKTVNAENDAEEIVVGIDKAITLAQDLREKVKLDAVSSKRTLKKSPIKNIYSSKSPSVNDKKVLRKNISTQKINIANTCNSKNSTTLPNEKINSLATKKSSLNCVDSTRQNNTNDKIRSKALPAEEMRSRKEKNFMLINKSNIKKICPSSKSQITDRRDTPGTSRKYLQPTTSAAELNTLIHKVTQQSIENILVYCSSNSNKKETKCPLHEENTLVKERNTTIDVACALQRFNIPNEIIKTLRTYHKFQTKVHHSNNTKNDKNESSIDIFLTEFEETNTTIRDHLLQESHLINIVTKLISLFSYTFSENLNLIQLNEIKITITEINAALKQYNIENIVAPIKRPYCNLSLANGWISNGIWNISCMQHFKGFSKAYNIKYNNKGQLLSLYEAIQKLQRAKYLNTLIQIILQDVTPVVTCNIGSMDTEYVQVFKTISILSQGLNPKAPVLVRTDDSY